MAIFLKGEGIRRKSKWAPNHGMKDKKETMVEKKERVHDPERSPSAGAGV
jgi:sigma54-dependent transcription regulator